MEGNVFSQPWQDSDAVLVAEGEEFHVHRCILSLQSSAFKAMFSGNFKDASQDRIQFKDDSKRAMLIFLKLLYPDYMLEGDDAKKVEINNGNVLAVIKLADKYGAINIVKACMKAETLDSKTTMLLFPYAIRYDFPIEGIIDTIIRRVSVKELVKFAPQLDNDSMYVETLVSKCEYLEKVASQSHHIILHLLRRADSIGSKVQCVEHGRTRMWRIASLKECTSCGLMWKEVVEMCLLGHVSPYDLSAETIQKFLTVTLDLARLYPDCRNKSY